MNKIKYTMNTGILYETRELVVVFLPTEILKTVLLLGFSKYTQNYLGSCAMLRSSREPSPHKTPHSGKSFPLRSVQTCHGTSEMLRSRTYELEKTKKQSNTLTSTYFNELKAV